MQFWTGFDHITNSLIKNVAPHCYFCAYCLAPLSRAYLWRVKPSAVADAASLQNWAFSCLGGPFALPVLSPLCQKLFGGATIVNSKNEPVALQTLAGKVLGVYFSASWCPPCKQYTPQLANFYTSLKNNGHPFEVIIVLLLRTPWHFGVLGGGIHQIEGGEFTQEAQTEARKYIRYKHSCTSGKTI